MRSPLLLPLLSLLACRSAPAPTAPKGLSGWHELKGFPERPYLLHLPKEQAPTTPTPVVLVLHGGGGQAANTNALTCQKGDTDSPSCITALADQEGFAVVFPNGTSHPNLKKLRTWNAGGGGDGFQCVSGNACQEKVDDVAYFKALLDDLDTQLLVDKKRVYATGLSNGGAMSYRLACELSDRIAAVAPVGGGDQLSTTAACQPTRPVSILHIHGTSDPCWSFNGGPASCLQDDGMKKISVAESISNWVTRDGCDSSPQEREAPEGATEDNTHTKISRYAGCKDNAEVVLYTIEDGGHTWPQGNPYLSERRIGRVSQDFSANQVIWDFFKAHPMP